jgi:hypothetical protein
VPEQERGAGERRAFVEQMRSSPVAEIVGGEFPPLFRTEHLRGRVLQDLGEAVVPEDDPPRRRHGIERSARRWRERDRTTEARLVVRIVEHEFRGAWRVVFGDAEPGQRLRSKARLPRDAVTLSHRPLAFADALRVLG